MKVYISADIEGVTGVVHPDQIYPDGKFYNEALEVWAKELNAIIEGLTESGIESKDIFINDSHNHMRNLSALNIPTANLILGWQKTYSMVSQINLGFDIAFFTGYHSMASTNGVLSHTYRPRIIKEVKLNNILVGETGLNSALAGYYNVPVGLVTGDNVLCDEARKLFGKNTVYVETKKAISRYSALSYSLEENLKTLKEGAILAIKNKIYWKPYKPETPTILSVRFAESNHADAVELIPQVKRIGSAEVEYTSHDFSIVFKCFLAMGALAASRDDVLT